MRTLIFLGPPGSGKGTQAKILAEKLSIPHISLGDMLREEVRAGSGTGKRAKEAMDAGRLVPDELTIDLARKRINREDCRSGYIFDGFPRSMIQAAALEKTPIDRVVYFRIAEEEAVKRLLRRAELEGRADDSEEAIRTRFEVYEKETRPLIDYYARMGKLLEIDAARPIEQVSLQLWETLK